MRARHISVPVAAVGPVVLAVSAISVLVGCSATVSGVAVPSTEITAGSPSGKGLSSLLVDPSDFPSRYSAIVLPAQAVALAAPDLTGVPQGSVVDPAECAPPSQDYGPTGTVMAVGTDTVSRSTISVELARTETPLGELEKQTRDCGEITVTAQGATATVTTEITPAPPVHADDSLALRRTVTSGNASDKVTQSMVTLMAQVGDVRVSATFMSFGDAKPDTVALDELFTAAVHRVQTS